MNHGTEFFLTGTVGHTFVLGLAGGMFVILGDLLSLRQGRQLQHLRPSREQGECRFLAESGHAPQIDE